MKKSIYVNNHLTKFSFHHYLLRDSYNTGTNYGLVDLERIISALTFLPDGNIGIKPKGVIAIEHFLVLRNLSIEQSTITG